MHKESVSLGKKTNQQKTSAHVPSSVTTFISYGMNCLQESLTLLTLIKSVGEVSHQL